MKRIKMPKAGGTYKPARRKSPIGAPKLMRPFTQGKAFKSPSRTLAYGNRPVSQRSF